MTSVLHIISGLGVGGAETMLLQVAQGLSARGHAQHVLSVTGTGPMAARIEDAGVPVTAIDLRSLAGKAAAAVTLPRLVRRLRPDIIQGWMYHGDITATLAQALAPRSQRPRLAWGIRCSDMDLARNARLIRLCSWLSERPDVVVANSRVGADIHMARGYTPQRLEVIANGIDSTLYRPDAPSRADVRAELGLDSSRRIALHVARVDPMKDQATFLTALRQQPEITGVLVGKGTKDLDLPANAIALGRRMDVPRLLASADMIVSSSAFGEGFSNALAEGMSAGLIPVTTDVGDAREIVGDTGTVVAPSDAAALAVAMGEIADLDGYTLARRGAAARTRIMSHFAIDQAVDRFEALYLSL